MAGMWIRAGSVSVTSGSKKVIGSGTGWVSVTTNKPAKGHTFWGPDTNAYEIDYVESDTVLYLADSYGGPSVSGQPYRIDNTRDSSIPALSRKVSEFYAYQQGYIDALGAIVGGSGNVTFDAPDGQSVTVPALSNMLSKSGNLAGLGDQRQARINLGLTGGASLPIDDDIKLPSKLMRWENYGQGHVIFDASKGLSPNLLAVNKTDPAVPWSPNLPTLMGWNGSQTYGLRVDSSRVSERWPVENYGNTASTYSFLPFDFLISDEAGWFRLVRLPASTIGTRDCVTIRGSYGAWTGYKTNFEITVSNREGFKISADALGGGRSNYLGLDKF